MKIYWTQIRVLLKSYQHEHLFGWEENFKNIFETRKLLLSAVRLRKKGKFIKKSYFIRHESSFECVIKMSKDAPTDINFLFSLR